MRFRVSKPKINQNLIQICSENKWIEWEYKFIGRLDLLPITLN